MLAALAPVDIAERDWTGTVLVVADSGGLVGCRHLVEHHSEAKHVNRCVHEAFAKLWSHITYSSNSLCIYFSIAVKVSRQAKVAQFCHVVLFDNIGALFENVF